MFRKIEDFLSVWKYETQSTLNLYKQLTAESFDQRVYEGGRDLRTLVDHINHSVTELPNTAGLPIELNQTVYASPVELMEHYARDCAKVAEVVAANWTDAQMEEEIPMYGMKWSKGTTLHILVTHQTHHRGQLTVLMRQAGLKVPGMYGPSKEEWEKMGMEPLK